MELSRFPKAVRISVRGQVMDADRRATGDPLSTNLRASSRHFARQRRGNRRVHAQAFLEDGHEVLLPGQRLEVHVVKTGESRPDLALEKSQLVGVHEKMIRGAAQSGGRRLRASDHKEGSGRMVLAQRQAVDVVRGALFQDLGPQIRAVGGSGQTAIDAVFRVVPVLPLLCADGFHFEQPVLDEVIGETAQDPHGPQLGAGLDAFEDRLHPRRIFGFFEHVQGFGETEITHNVLLFGQLVVLLQI